VVCAGYALLLYIKTSYKRGDKQTVTHLRDVILSLIFICSMSIFEGYTMPASDLRMCKLWDACRIRYALYCICMCFTYSKHSNVFGIVIKVRTGRSGLRIPIGARDFFPPLNVQAGSGAVPACIQRAPGFFSGSKAFGAWS